MSLKQRNKPKIYSIFRNKELLTAHISGLGSGNYSAKKLKLRRVLETFCGAFERCSRVRL